MAEVVKTTKRGWRRRRAEGVDTVEVEDLELGDAAPPRPRGRQLEFEAPAVRVDSTRLMDPLTPLPTEPKVVKYDGHHLFMVLVAYEVDPYQMVAGGSPQMDARTALDVSKPTCYWCGDVWSLRGGRTPCSGRER